MTTPAHFRIGYITRARGLEGQVVVRTFDPGSLALEEVDRVLLVSADGAGRELRVKHRSGHGGECVLTLEGIADRTAADGLVGSTVTVLREDLKAPAEGECFQGDLIGLEAVDEAGASLGKVEEIWNTGPVPNLVIRGLDRPELLVPFVDDFVRSVDLAGGRVVLRPPEILE